MEDDEDLATDSDDSDNLDIEITSRKKRSRRTKTQGKSTGKDSQKLCIAPDKAPFCFFQTKSIDTLGKHMLWLLIRSWPRWLGCMSD